MTLALHSIDLEISDDLWVAIAAYARETDCSIDEALDVLLSELLKPSQPDDQVKLMCEACHAFTVHAYAGTKAAGMLAREQIYRCACGASRRFGLVT